MKFIGIRSFVTGPCQSQYVHGQGPHKLNYQQTQINKARGCSGVDARKVHAAGFCQCMHGLTGNASIQGEDLRDDHCDKLDPVSRLRS